MEMQKRMAILAALVNQDLSALEIIAAVKKATRGRIRIPEGSIYADLEALERDKLVKGEYRKGSETPARRGRPRRYYKILAKGLRALSDLDAIRGMELGDG